jgi:hypothetical protein
MANNINLESLLGAHQKNSALLLGENDKSFFETNIAQSNLTTYHSRATTLPTYDSASGIDGTFSGTSGRSDILNQIRNDMKTHGELSRDLGDGLEEIGSGRGSEKLKRMLERSEGGLKRNTDKLYDVAQKLVNKHEEAAKVGLADLAKAKADLTGIYHSARAELTTAKVEMSRASYTGGPKEVRIGTHKLSLPDAAAAEEQLKRLTANYDNAVSRFADVSDAIKVAHGDTVSELKGLMGEVEKVTGIERPSALIKKATTIAEKESNQIEHMAEDAARGGSKLKGAAIGGAIGGVVGYAVSGDENKGTGTMLGAVGGGIIGAIAQGWQSSKAALGGVMHGREAQRLLAGAERTLHI